MVFDFVLLDNYMVYNNSFNFFIKTFGKELPINIFQFSKRIECTYKIIEYSGNMKFIDTDLKLAMKHFFIQSQVDYINAITNQKKLTTQDLGFFSNMLVMKGLTSSPAINLLNIETNLYEKVNSTFFADKKICGALSEQYLSPLTTFIFNEEWSKLTDILKYEKILNYDKTFLLNLNKDILTIAESFWESKIYSDDYNNKDHFVSSFKQLLESQYWIHNFGDFKLYKSPNNFYTYPEIYQILYNIEFKYNESLKKFEILFDSVFFEKSLIENQNLQIYKDFNKFEEVLNNWRNEDKLSIYKKNLGLLSFMEKKYYIEEYDESELKESILKVFYKSKDSDCCVFLILMKRSNINRLKLKDFLIKSNLVFFYYISYTEFFDRKKDVLWVCIKKEFSNNIYDIFYGCEIVFEEPLIVNCLINEVNWEKTDLYNHYLWWDSNHQLVISDFIDFFCGGLVFILPETWN